MLRLAAPNFSSALPSFPFLLSPSPPNFSCLFSASPAPRLRLLPPWHPMFSSRAGGGGTPLDVLQMWAASGAFTWNSNCLGRFSPVTKFSNLQTVSKAHAHIQAEKGKLMKETPPPPQQFTGCMKRNLNPPHSQC